MIDGQGHHIVVLGIGTAGPYLRVPDDDAKGLAAFFDARCIAYDRYELLDGVEFSFGIQTNTDCIQIILDAHSGPIPKPKHRYAIRFGHPIPAVTD